MKRTPVAYLVMSFSYCLVFLSDVEGVDWMIRLVTMTTGQQISNDTAWQPGFEDSQGSTDHLVARTSRPDPLVTVSKFGWRRAPPADTSGTSSRILEERRGGRGGP